MRVRIKETGQILNVEYDDDDLYKGWDGGAVWFYANEFDIIGDEEPNDERLFTLTAEEVEIVNYALVFYEGMCIMGDSKRKNLNNLLTRINNSKDERDSK